MTVSERDQYLEEAGFRRPFDESPVPVPTGWTGGEVHHTGGDLYCRRWRNFNERTNQEPEALEVIYSPSQDGRVAVQRYGWRDGCFVYDEVVEQREAGSDDSDVLSVVQQLLTEYSS